MKYFKLYLTVILAIILMTGISKAKEPLANATVILTCSNGKTYTTTSSSNGSFSIKRDEECDDFTISVETNGMSLSNSKWSWGLSQSGSSSTRRDIATGQASGKRQHQPIKVSTSVCASGDCASSSSVCKLELTVTGPVIQGMAINEKGLPGNSKPKSNK